MNDYATPRFSLRTLLELIAVAAFALYLLYGQVAYKQRYQLRIIDSQVAGGEVFILFDTQTGNVWSRSYGSSGPWSDYPAPNH
jgi:hypothetical protein